MSLEPCSPQLEEALHDFNARRRWPKDVADLVASCQPSDELLLELMRRDSERHQSLALHVIAQLIRNDPSASPGEDVAREVLRLLAGETFKPKRRYLRSLIAWAQQV